VGVSGDVGAGVKVCVAVGSRVFVGASVGKAVGLP
jgi:hypothetical protein